MEASASGAPFASNLRVALEQGAGVLRLRPAWVPRSFTAPGRRLRLHPDDYYALGSARGGICERWIASTVRAENGPLAAADEGLSYAIAPDGAPFLLRDAIEDAGDTLLGADAMAAHGGWVTLSKLFDNRHPLPHHMHHNDEFAARVGRLGKPEAYFFPAQYNETLGAFPFTFFGIEPGVSQGEVIDCLKRWETGDNGILDLSRAYALRVDTGWDVPPGILHAPGTLCTYEPQRSSDVFSAWQSLIAGFQLFDRAMLVRDVPPEHHEDYDYLISMLDWEANTDTHFRRHRFCPPIATMQNDNEAGYTERWIVYGSPWFSAKEIAVLPGRTVTISEPAAFGALCVQGRGSFGAHAAAAPSVLRYGQMSEDEFFVGVGAARQGVTISNASSTEPLVFLNHFNPGHPGVPSHESQSAHEEL